MLGKAISIFMQAAYFILVARSLGTENFGMFMGVTSLAAVVVPFAALGSGDILVKYVSRNKALFREYWGNALVTTFCSSSVVICLSFFLAKLILPSTISASVILFILVGDVLGLAIWNIACGAFIAFDLHRKTAQLQVCLNLTKLLAAVILATFIQDPTPKNWSILYFTGTIFTALVSILIVNKILGFPRANLSQLKNNISQGVYFSIDRSAAFINASIDKTMLASLSTLNATGLYAAAYRLIEVAYLPILVIFGSTYAKFFEQGEFGIKGTLKLAKRLLPIILIYGIIVCIGYQIFAPVVPYLLGDDYAASIPVLYWLSPMPLIMGIQLILADTLTGAGYQRLRGLMQLSAAFFNVSLNYYLIPLYSWKGAVWATLATDSLIVICSCAAVVFFYRQQIQASQIKQTSSNKDS